MTTKTTSFPYKAALFDWAHTLVDLVEEDDRAAFAGMMDFLRHRGVTLPKFETLYAAYQDLFYAMIEESRRIHREACFETVLRYLFFRYGIAAEDRVSWREILTVYYEVIHSPRRVFPEVFPALEAMRDRGVRMGVVSNTTNPGFIKDEERVRTGLDPFFEFAVYSSDMPYRKPHPTIFRAALERLGLEARDVLFVGDSLASDVAGAQAVGMHAAWVNRQGALPSGGITPDYQLTSLSDLLQLEALKI